MVKFGPLLLVACALTFEQSRTFSVKSLSSAVLCILFNMLSRLSAVSRRAAPIRRFSVFDKFAQDPETQKRAAQILDDPKMMSEALNSFNTVFKEGGGGMMGAMLRNSPVKGALEKMGGIENLERMMKDPAAIARVREMMKDPAMVAKAQEDMKNLFGKKE